MRGSKAKKFRRQAYGPGMPRTHEYKDLNGPHQRYIRDPKHPMDINKAVVIKVPGTMVITSARRLYQLLKRGEQVQVGRVA